MKKEKDPKAKARLFKIIGGGLLLLSFIVQNYAYDYWDKEAEEYYNSNKDFSDMSRSSLLYLNLYFSSNVPDKALDSIVKGQYINMAAQKAALGQTVEITTRDMDKQEKLDLCNALLQKAKTVKTFEDYLGYINFSRTSDTYTLKDSVDRVDRINKWRNASRWGFLLTYIIGSAILLFGFKYE